jgi:hypothetical protein
MPIVAQSQSKPRLRLPGPQWKRSSRHFGVREDLSRCAHQVSAMGVTRQCGPGFRDCGSSAPRLDFGRFRTAGRGAATRGCSAETRLGAPAPPGRAGPSVIFRARHQPRFHRTRPPLADRNTSWSTSAATPGPHVFSAAKLRKPLSVTRTFQNLRPISSTTYRYPPPILNCRCSILKVA